MIHAIVFSKDRPAQLDLLLRSVAMNAPWIDRVTVIYRPSEQNFLDGYELCERYHARVQFQRESDFRAQTLEGLRHGDYTVFLCDDDVIYRPYTGPPIDMVLSENPEVLTFSLRLGRGINYCYSLGHSMREPTEIYPLRTPEWTSSLMAWEWRTADADWGYPGSLDGNVWRTDQLRILLANGFADWNTPNELEDALNGACRTALLPLMASNSCSHLVGVPVNSVQTVYKPNRYGERFPCSPRILNDGLLEGERLSLDSIAPEQVNAAHVEFLLEWEPRKVIPGSPRKILEKKAGER